MRNRTAGKGEARRPFGGGLRLRWIGVLALPLLLGGWMIFQRAVEEASLQRASLQFQRGEWQAALDSLEPLRARPLLSGLTRRRAAELYFRLGEDQKAHRLLVGQKFHPEDPADERLKALAAHCQRAEALIRQADQAKSPEQRYRLTRRAQQELPQAPHVLQRLVKEELALLLRQPESEAASRFETDYTQLRVAAPKLAAQVRTEAEALAGEVR